MLEKCSVAVNAIKSGFICVLRLLALLLGNVILFLTHIHDVHGTCEGILHDSGIVHKETQADRVLHNEDDLDQSVSL